MRQKVPYGVMGFLVGAIVAALIFLPILQSISQKPMNQLEQYAWPSILVLGIAGVFGGLRLDKYLNATPTGRAKANSLILKYLGFLATTKRRTEGNFVIYEINMLGNLAVAGILILYAFYGIKYVPRPYGEILFWVVAVTYGISGLPMASDGSTAISKKIVTSAFGKKEIWYELPPNNNK